MFSIWDGGGIDTIVSTAGLSLADYANVENLTVTGTASAKLIGTTSSNILIGGAGDEAGILQFHPGSENGAADAKAEPRAAVEVGEDKADAGEARPTTGEIGTTPCRGEGRSRWPPEQYKKTLRATPARVSLRTIA